MAAWTVGSGLGPVALAGAWLLWLLEVAAVVLFLSYGYEIHDTLGSLRWERRWVADGSGLGERARARARAKGRGAADPAGVPSAPVAVPTTGPGGAVAVAGAGTGVLAAQTDCPFVSIHVPSHNEPPDMVIDTLRSLLALDYPAFEVLVLDNNTTDDALCAPVQSFCAQHADRVRFHRLLDWPG